MRAMTVALAVCLLGGAEEDAVRKEMSRLEGEWSMVSGEIDRQPLPAEYVQGAKRVARNGETAVTIGGRLFMKARYTVDLGKSPKAIDYAMTDGPTKGKTQLGIYELDGDTVKFCFAAPGKERPKDFTTAAGSGRTLSVWKRTRK